jgi:hypothetical protein
MGPDVVVAGQDREPPVPGEGGQDLGGPDELGGLAGEGQVPGHQQVVDLLLPQGGDELLGDLEGVPVAVARREAVARVAGAVPGVQVADVA